MIIQREHHHLSRCDVKHKVLSEQQKPARCWCLLTRGSAGHDKRAVGTLDVAVTDMIFKVLEAVTWSFLEERYPFEYMRTVPLWNRAENGSVKGNLGELIRLDGFLLYNVPPIRLSSTHFVFTSVRGSVWLRESARCDLVMLLILLHVAVMGVGLWLLCAHMRTQRDSVETKQPLKRLQEKKCRNSHMALLILLAPRSCCFLHCEQRWCRDVRMQKRNPKYFFILFMLKMQQYNTPKSKFRYIQHLYLFMYIDLKSKHFV